MAVRRNIAWGLLVLAAGVALAALFRKPQPNVPSPRPAENSLAWRDAVVPPPQPPANAGGAARRAAPSRGGESAAANAGRQRPALAIPPTPAAPQRPAAEPGNSLDAGPAPPPLAEEFPSVGWPGPSAADRSRRGVSADDCAAEEVPELRWVVHIVADGDSLSALAARYWGDPSRGWQILEDNRAWISDPDALPIGVPLQIRMSASDDPHATRMP